MNKLIDDNKKLREELLMLKVGATLYREDNKTLREENKKLKEELKMLKECYKKLFDFN